MGTKRAGAKGFHEGIFDQGFGGFTPLKKRAAGGGVMEKRRPEMTSRGIHGDAFTSKTDGRMDKPTRVERERERERERDNFFQDSSSSS